MAGQNIIKLLLLSVFLGIGGVAIFLRQDEEGVRQYTVARPKPTHRMLAAIIPRMASTSGIESASAATASQSSQAWFLKLVGPIEAVDAHAHAFHDVVQNMQFGTDPAARPTFTLPKGWTREPGGELRFATLRIESVDTPLECSVTELPISDPDLPGFMLANINRWREQMRLRKLSRSEMPTETTQIDLKTPGVTATVVDLSGVLSQRAMAQSSGPAMPAAPFAGQAGTRKPAEKMSYSTPDGWTPGKLEVSRMGVTVSRLAAFEVRDGDHQAEITVTKLSASAVLVNVNRWRGQIGLSEMTADELLGARKDIDFAGATADYVQFFAVEQAILGVIAVRGDSAWFIKLQGHSELAARERQKFEEFVRSIRLSPSS